MNVSWLSLLPPFMVIILASVTKRLNMSLLLGLGIATLIASQGNPLQAAALLGNRLFTQAYDFETFCNYFFLIIISSLIVLIGRTGGAIAFAHAITKHLKSARAVETASMSVSGCLFIDDYLSNLTVGYAMRPLTDRFAIPRVKLAYLVHALSSPLLIICPVSSWIAILTGRLEDASITSTITETTKIIGEPFVIYLQSIPFMFYSIILIASVWFVVHKRISFGPMHTQETIAQKTGNLFGGKEPVTNTITIESKPHANAWDFILPVGLLISSIFIGFLYGGGFWLFGGTHTFLGAFQHVTNTALIILIASIITYSASLIMALVRHTITSTEIIPVFKEGTLAIYSAILMIFLATTLGTILTKDLSTGQYIASLIQGSLAPWLLPLILFIVATITSFTIGSTWGTMAIITPIGTQILISLLPGTTPFDATQIPLLLPTIGAIFTGAICGNHNSPVSDTTIMASTSCGAYPIDHIYTQLPYVIPVIISTSIAFLLAGFLAPYGLAVTLLASLGIGIIGCLGMLYGADRFAKRK